MPESLFWADFAAHLASEKEEPFLSQHLVHAGHTFTDAVAALAVTGKASIQLQSHACQLASLEQQP